MTGVGGGRVAAAIDVGSNSVLLLTVAVEPDGRARAIDEAGVTTRLGTGLVERGSLDPNAARRTRECVVEFTARARRSGARTPWAFATGAARRACDGEAFVVALARAAACEVEILSGEREAALAYAAAVDGLGLHGRSLLVVDVGGVTTELTLGTGPAIRASTSLALGALALTEACGGDAERLGARVEAELATTDIPRQARTADATIVGCGGTATALAALALGLGRYDPSRVHGARLAARDLVPLATSRGAGGAALDPGRATILPAGACILAAVMAATEGAVLTVSDHGVRHAYLRERLARSGVVVDMRRLWS